MKREQTRKDKAIQHIPYNLKFVIYVEYKKLLAKLNFIPKCAFNYNINFNFYLLHNFKLSSNIFNILKNYLLTTPLRDSTGDSELNIKRISLINPE